MYEHRTSRPISRRHFALRLLRSAGVGGVIIVISMAIGMAGFRATESSFSWLDCYLNTAMLLGGMGQVDKPLTDGGKLFAGAFALYAGLAVIVVAGLLLTPVIHRVLHVFHWEEDGSGAA
jgi:hypothetical protein